MTGEAKVTLPALMGDGMVLQRNATVNIWGSSDRRGTVRVRTSWDGRIYRTRVADDGSWAVKAVTADAGGPYTISVSDGEETVLDNILLGEVWLCSGQSNMEMPLIGFPSQPVDGSAEVIAEAGRHSTLRVFHLKRNPVERSFNKYFDAQWERVTPDVAAETSAIGYLFAARLNDILGIPIGLIEADWGGTRIETWMSVENNPASLWNNMVKPLSAYTLRGFLWYQGESNNAHPYEYDKLMEGMVRLWRSAWASNGADAPAINPALKGLGNGEQMPFLFAQLAPYDYNTENHTHYDICAPLMWEAQIRAFKAITNSDIAVNVDLGSAFYIHPPKKKILAERFVMLAIHDAYAKGGTDTYDWRGPLFKSVNYEDGAAIVEFEMVSTICPTRPFGDEAPIYGFEIAGEDRVFHKAEAYAVHDGYNFSRKVKVSSPEVPHPVAVRYAFDNLPGELNLTNSAGLPAFPFRTDNWDDVE